MALPRAGGRPVELDLSVVGDPVDPAKVRAILDGIDGLVLGGGGDVDPALFGGEPADSEVVDRHADEVALELLRQAEARGMPVLGICRGCQILNVARGGTLTDLRERPEIHDRHFLPAEGHAIHVAPGSRVAAHLERIELEGVMSTHRWGIGRLGRGVALESGR